MVKRRTWQKPTEEKNNIQFWMKASSSDLK